ncbi:MAG: Lrp/AsnC family transcriptional regulator [Chloroflexota bacterium]
MSMLDNVDRKLMQLMERNASQTSEKLAKQLKVSSATVRRRLKRLMQSNALHVIGVADPALLGYKLAVVIALDIVPEKLGAAMDMLGDRPEVKWVSPTTGRFDVIAIARFPSTEALSQFMMHDLSRLEGLKDSETFICLDVKNGHRIPLI